MHRRHNKEIEFTLHRNIFFLLKLILHTSSLLFNMSLHHSDIFSHRQQPVANFYIIKAA